MQQRPKEPSLIRAVNAIRYFGSALDADDMQTRCDLEIPMGGGTHADATDTRADLWASAETQYFSTASGVGCGNLLRGNGR